MTNRFYEFAGSIYNTEHDYQKAILAWFYYEEDLETLQIESQTDHQKEVLYAEFLEQTEQYRDDCKFDPEFDFESFQSILPEVIEDRVHEALGSEHAEREEAE